MAVVADLELNRTRAGLHALAEQVVAAAQYRATGDIRLRVVPGGFAATRALHGDVLVSVLGDRLVVDEPGGRRSARISTVAASAEFVGIEASLPESAYPAATEFHPDEPLHIDEAAARVLADWYAFGDAALRSFAIETGTDAEPILWPEHFDVGITVGEVNYGASPGDDHIAEPYVYVGPHAGPPRRDAFWNTPFGAARTRGDVQSVADVVTFFREARSAAGGER